MTEKKTLKVAELPKVTKKVPVEVNAGQTSIEVATITEEPKPESAALRLMRAALVQVEEVLAKADQTATMLQQNITQVNNQRIGLAHQKSMLTELINRSEKEENK